MIIFVVNVRFCDRKISHNAFGRGWWSVVRVSTNSESSIYSTSIFAVFLFLAIAILCNFFLGSFVTQCFLGAIGNGVRLDSFVHY